MKMNYIRFIRPILAGCMALLAFACSTDEGVDNREADYGYVQFKLYKAASYEQTPAEASTRVQQLDYLADAAKIRVTLRTGNGTELAQTLTVASDGADPEFGVRSEKLQLLSGDYRVVEFTLYDKADEELYFDEGDGSAFTVTAGGLTVRDLTVDVQPRGKVTFTIVKEGIGKTRANYTMDEITKANITVMNKSTRISTTFNGLEFKFSIHFDQNNEADDTFGWQTSDLACDSVLLLPAGDYRINSYEVYNKYSNLLESRSYSDANPIAGDFTVDDNRTTEVKMGLKIDQSSAYIQDYVALKAIWEKLNGKNWRYSGQLFAKGCNWNFNKDIDLWGDQPGVQLHSNGRVAAIDISDFGASGFIPDEIGQLTELVELYIGTHNDANMYYSTADPSLDRTKSLAERKRNRMALNKQYLAALHPAPQMSEPCARSLREHNTTVPESAMYELGYKESELIDMTTGHSRSLQLMEVPTGKLCNGITGISDKLGELKRLELLFIANGEFTALPDVFDRLSSLTDLEIYNCPKMAKFPTEIAKAPELVSINLSNNPQWAADDVCNGLRELANGASRKNIQLLYCTNGSLEEIPEEFNKMEKLGLLDMAYNKIRTLHAMPKVSLVQLYLDNNEIESFPTDESGVFCKMMDMETFSASRNKLKKFPDIFYSNGFTISSIDLSSNEIDEVEKGFKGIRVQTLTLTNNRFEFFPRQLINSDGNRNSPEYDSSVGYIVFRANNLRGFEEGAFKGTNSKDLLSLDLSYNHLTEFPNEFSAQNMPYLYGLDISNNAFSKFPFQPFDAYTLTIYAVRAQRDSEGRRCLREWPTGVFQHTGLRGLYLGSNDLRVINDQISYLIYYLDISDNPNITFDAADICANWKAGLYYLIYDKTQNILNCEEMLQ